MQIILIMILFVLMVTIGGDRGAASFVSLCGNCLVLLGCIFFMNVGFNYIGVTFISCILVCVITLFYPNGINIKSLASFLSVIIVIMVLFFTTFFLENGFYTRGFSFEQQMEDSMNGLSTGIDLNMYQIAISVVIMCLTGAILDASVSIASSVNEVYLNNLYMDRKELILSGLRIGRDIIGTTVNTLFFAYMGESLMLFIRFHFEGYSFARIINSKGFAQEFIRIIYSGASCILIIPITAFIIAFFLKRKSE